MSLAVAISEDTVSMNSELHYPASLEILVS